MAAPLALPLRPVAVQQFGVDPRLDLAGLLLVQQFLVAGVVGAAFRVHAAGEDQVLAVGREDMRRRLRWRASSPVWRCRRRGPSARSARSRCDRRRTRCAWNRATSAGAELASPSCVICRGAPPSSGTIQICTGFLLAATSTVCTVNATHLPSGEICGSLRRFRERRASTSNGLRCANSIALEASNRTRKQRISRL